MSSLLSKIKENGCMKISDIEDKKELDRLFKTYRVFNPMEGYVAIIPDIKPLKKKVKSKKRKSK